MISSPQKLKKEKFEADKLAKRLRHNVQDALLDFDMIQEGDKVMVCLSGGKDSFGLLDLMLSIKRNFPRNFEIIAVNLDQKQPGFPSHILPEYLEPSGFLTVSWNKIRTPWFSVSFPRGKPLAVCVPGCAVGLSTRRQWTWGPIK